jgi:hypothetical protein
MRMPALVAVLLALPFAAVSQSATTDAIAYLRAGVVCGPPVVGSSPAPDTIAGSTHLIDETPPFIAEITQVPAVIGIGFGVKAQALDPLGLSDVTVIVTHPPMGEAGVTRQSYASWISGTEPSMTFYQFDNEYERVTGTWTFTGVRGGAELFSVDFEVVPPDALPGLAEACRYGELLS